VPEENRHFEPWLLLGTMAQTAAVTFYVPVIRPVLLPTPRSGAGWRRRRTPTCSHSGWSTSCLRCSPST
jgi:hypothetical protein